MSGKIKAIETRYKGYRFRSRLEARWAVCFDVMEIGWEYEKEGFELPSGRYLPDFWVPIKPSHNYGGHAGAGYFIEIKGAPPTLREKSLAADLARITKHTTKIFVGPPWDFDRFIFHRSSPFLRAGTLDAKSFGFPSNAAFLLCVLDNQVGGNGSILRAMDAAKAARFEFGEHGP